MLNQAVGANATKVEAFMGNPKTIAELVNNWLKQQPDGIVVHDILYQSDSTITSVLIVYGPGPSKYI